MNKFFLSLALSLVSLCGFAQFEGTVVYAISMPDAGENAALMAAMMPTETTIQIGKNKNRIEMKMGMGMQNVTITDKKTKEVVSLMDMMGNKMAIVLNPEDMKDKTQSDLKLTTADAGDNLEIAGHKCKHAILEDKSGMKVDVYYTDDFGTENYSASAQDQFKDIKGMLLKYTVAQKGMKMTLTAKSVKKEPIDDSKFIVPADYKKVTQQELMKMYGGK